MTTYFTSDWHFRHKNIIQYCNRPFSSTKEMDSTIIKNYNQIVKPDDQVFILGDIGIAPAETLSSIIRSLHGHKHLILGNHDEYKATAYINMGFDSVHSTLILSPSSLWPDIQEDWLLTHDPVIQICTQLPTLCGHIHQIAKFVGKAMNVGVDVWNFKPIPITTVEEQYKKYGDNLFIHQ